MRVRTGKGGQWMSRGELLVGGSLSRGGVAGSGLIRLEDIAHAGNRTDVAWLAGIGLYLTPQAADQASHELAAAGVVGISPHPLHDDVCGQNLPPMHHECVEQAELEVRQSPRWLIVQTYHVSGRIDGESGQTQGRQGDQRHAA